MDEVNKWRMEALKFKAAYGKVATENKMLKQGIETLQQRFNQAILTLTDEVRLLRRGRR